MDEADVDGAGAGAAVIKPFTVPSFGGQPAAASDAFAGMRATSAEAHTVQIKTADPLPVGQGQWQGKEGMTTNTPALGPASGSAYYPLEEYTAITCSIPAAWPGQKPAAVTLRLPQRCASTV